MDPNTGTFLSVDPLVPDYRDPQSLNAYAYARNNPVSFVDPTGAFMPPLEELQNCNCCSGFAFSPGYYWGPNGSGAITTMAQYNQIVNEQNGSTQGADNPSTNTAQTSGIGLAQAGLGLDSTNPFEGITQDQINELMEFENEDGLLTGRLPEAGEFFLPPDARAGLNAVFGEGATNDVRTIQKAWFARLHLIFIGAWEGSVTRPGRIFTTLSPKQFAGSISTSLTSTSTWSGSGMLG